MSQTPCERLTWTGTILTGFQVVRSFGTACRQAAAHGVGADARRPQARRSGRGARRGGFSLLEVVLSLAILGGSMAVLGEAARHGMDSARIARDLTDAQLYCESKMAELEAGLITLDPVSDARIEPMTDSSLESSAQADEVIWLYSIETEMVDDGLILVYLSVSQDPSLVKKPVTFTLTQMFLDESAISTETETEEAM